MVSFFSSLLLIRFPLLWYGCSAVGIEHLFSGRHVHLCPQQCLLLCFLYFSFHVSSSASQYLFLPKWLLLSLKYMWAGVPCGPLKLWAIVVDIDFRVIWYWLWLAQGNTWSSPAHLTSVTCCWSTAIYVQSTALQKHNLLINWQLNFFCFPTGKEYPDPQGKNLLWDLLWAVLPISGPTGVGLDSHVSGCTLCMAPHSTASAQYSYTTGALSGRILYLSLCSGTRHVFRLVQWSCRCLWGNIPLFVTATLTCHQERGCFSGTSLLYSSWIISLQGRPQGLSDM